MLSKTKHGILPNHNVYPFVIPVKTGIHALVLTLRAFVRVTQVAGSIPVFALGAQTKACILKQMYLLT